MTLRVLTLVGRGACQYRQSDPVKFTAADPRLRETVVHCGTWVAHEVLGAGEPFLGGSGDDGPIDDEGGR